MDESQKTVMLSGRNRYKGVHSVQFHSYKFLENENLLTVSENMSVVTRA